ncbi:MAG: AAA family ATPase, partial [Oscillochloris sp.]|nr:AAA family ATPase [Oscillochloris sp.]
LAGPPGTGKTIIAEALALESNLNMVKLRNIRQQWVGASERNLTRAFEIIRALSPILVFVDEIDQAFGSRGLGQSNDAGTSERMFGQVLEFIGDDRNRGRVIWVAATNRPDAIDAALLRRFDRIIPCLLPTADEQMMILEALPRTISMLCYDETLEGLIDERSPVISAMLTEKKGLIPT